MRRFAGLLPADAANLKVGANLDFHEVKSGSEVCRQFQSLGVAGDGAAERRDAFSKDVRDFDGGFACRLRSVGVQNQGTVALKKSPFRHAVGQGREGREASCAEEEGKEEVFHRPTKVRISF